MSLNLFKSLSDLSGALASARNHRSRLSPGQKRRPPRRRIVLETLEDRTLLSVSVATDQTDYAPGSTALISGGGFQPGDAITLQVVHTDGNPDVSPANDPWTVTADDSGNVSSSWYVDPASSTGDSLELQANDPTTGDSAVADFTDAIGSISPTSGPEGTGFTITVNRSGGTNYTASTRVVFGGTTLTTTLVNTSQVTAVVPASLITNEGPKTVATTSPAGGPLTFTVTEGDTLALAPQAVAATWTGSSSPSTFSGKVATLTDSTYDNQTGEFTASINWGDGSAASAGTVTRTGTGTYDVTGSHSYTSPYFQTAVRTATAFPATTIPVANASSASFPTSGTLTIFTGTGYQTVTYTGKTTGATATFTGVSGWTGSGTLAVGNTITEAFSPVTVTVTDPSPGTATATTTSALTVTDGIGYSPSNSGFTTTEGAVYTGSSPFLPGSIGTSVFPSTGYYMLKADNGSSVAWYTLYTSGPNNYMYPNSTTGSLTFPEEGSVSLTETLYHSNGSLAAAGVTGTVTVIDAGLSYFSAVNNYTSVVGVSTGSIQVGKFLDANPGDNHGDFTITVHWGDSSTDIVPAVYAGPNGSQATYTINGTHNYNAPGAYSVTYDVLDDGGSSLTAIHTANVTVSSPTISSVSTTTPTGTYDAGSVISITVNFTGPVFVTGTPRIQLNTTPTEYATYQSGSASNALTFTYTVQPGDNAARLDYASTGALTLNGGTIKDAGNNSIGTTLPTPAGGSDGLYSQNIVINTAPIVTDFRVIFGGRSYSLIGLGRDLPWQITAIQVSFSEPVTGNTSSLAGVGGTTIAGSGTSTLTWTLSSPLSLGSVSASLATSGTSGIADLSSKYLTGANTSETFSVLYGDFNGDRVVTSADVVGINNVIGSGVYNIFADLNGDGKVDATDVSIARSQNGKHL